MMFSPRCACNGRARQPSFCCCLLFAVYCFAVFVGLFCFLMIFFYHVFTSLCLQWSCSPTITWLLLFLSFVLFVCLFISFIMFSPHCACTCRACQPSLVYYLSFMFGNICLFCLFSCCSHLIVLAVVMLPNHHLFVVYCLAMFVCLFISFIMF